jgi:hypothetical protein
MAKRSVHRLQQAMARRGGYPESRLWETEAGRQWVPRRVVATLSTFGLKRGVGLATMHELFVRLRLQHQVGCSPTALRGVMPTRERTIVETAHRGAQGGAPPDEGHELMAAVDETFLEPMRLVCMALPRGYLLVAEVAAARTSATWKAVMEGTAQSPRRHGLLSGQ